MSDILFIWQKKANIREPNIGLPLPNKSDIGKAANQITVLLFPPRKCSNLSGISIEGSSKSERFTDKAFSGLKPLKSMPCKYLYSNVISDQPCFFFAHSWRFWNRSFWFKTRYLDSWWMKMETSKSKFGFWRQKINQILKIEDVAFVLWLVKHAAFF